MSTRGFVDSETEQIYFESWGHTGETVVLAHGMGGSHAVWYQQVPFLMQRHRVITWDQRGFGRSTSHSGDIGPVPAVRDLLGLLDHLEVEQAHIVGQSMGGWSALGFAMDHPDRVISLTLADTIAGIFTPEIRRSLVEYGVEAAAGLPPDQLPLGEHPAVGTQLRDEDLARSFLYSELASLTDPPPPMVIMPLLIATDHTARAGEVSVPTLFVVGDHDPIFPPPMIESAANFIRRGSVEVVENTGHSPYFERPARWNNIVGTFLQQSSL
jgi:pimeloyl-ACP methyl ester carboxylesterase